VLAAAVLWYLFRPELLFVDKKVSEDHPLEITQMPSEVALLAQGQFRGIAHETKGLAMIYQFPNGRKTLRLMDIETSNGPDVHVYLVALPDAPDDASVKNAEFIDLGSMKGNIGNQNYDIPADIDINKYRTCTIWCKRFGVNFGSAPLSL
jgi:hypothetical protein